LAVEDKFVVDQMKLFFSELYNLQNRELSIKEVLYYSSLIHLRFVHIHPFTDGNGRAARLLEKWFLTSKLGPNYWSLLSEKYYKDHQQEYYNAINLGVNFYEFNYSKCIPFLLMLPRAFENKGAQIA
jgi:Fic family protein